MRRHRGLVVGGNTSEESRIASVIGLEPLQPFSIAGWAKARSVLVTRAARVDLRWARLRLRAAKVHPSPISRSTSAVCSPSFGAGRGAAIGAPSIMIGVRMPGMLPAFASALGRSSFMPRWITCGSSNT